MKNKSAVQLLLNTENQGHGDVFATLLPQTKHLECVVAFAKSSALKDWLEPLRNALTRGMTARFAVGLDFYLTSPGALDALWKLSKTHSLELYLSDSRATFHPKIYAFQHARSCSVVVGSANLTHGGFYANDEASAWIEDHDGALMSTVIQYVDELIDAETLVSASKANLDKYAREYAIHDACRKVAKTRADMTCRGELPGDNILRDTLALMQSDKSERGFDAQKALRQGNLPQARSQLRQMASMRAMTKPDFLAYYEQLIGLFHSGGLQRQKTRIADHAAQFVAAVNDIMGRRNLSPAEAFDILHGHFTGITGAGINVLTEILHALDNQRFAVMNQNAVSGLMLAGITGYPLHPSKQNVKSERYARYCTHADEVRQSLKLADFTELDALFNYAYWEEESADEDD